MERVYYLFTLSLISLTFVNANITSAQENHTGAMSFDSYYDELVRSGDDYAAEAEDLKEILDELLREPLHLNSDDPVVLQELRLVSRSQLNHLRDYRIRYGDLLSVYELLMVEGWQRSDALRVMPLVTVGKGRNTTRIHASAPRKIHQQVVAKTWFQPEIKAGYRDTADMPGQTEGYAGSRFRYSLRYDARYRSTLAAGLRMEKDAGETLLSSGSWPLSRAGRVPDHLSAYVSWKSRRRPIAAIIGDYRVNFGYGLNVCGSSAGFSRLSGIVTMAYRIKPHTSMQESGYFRGAVVSAAAGPITVTIFASRRGLDVTSPRFDDSTNALLSYSSVTATGLHRTQSELAGKSALRETVFGGMGLFANRWMKAGLIAVSGRLSVPASASSKPYTKFTVNGIGTFSAGTAFSAYLRHFQVFGELSLNRARALAVFAGCSFDPAPGARITLFYRNFAKDFVNRFGSGIISPSRNENEQGGGALVSAELPGRSRLLFEADVSASRWLRYNLDFPTREYRASATWERNGKNGDQIAVSIHYKKSDTKMYDGFSMTDRRASQTRWNMRIEGRYRASPGVAMKTRAEAGFFGHEGYSAPLSWMIFQDISVSLIREELKIWARACLFQAPDYENRLYAYENDVLFDFSSFMYYGKGARGILMINWQSLDWAELWIRVATTLYNGRSPGSGLEKVNGNRLSEMELQVMVRLPG